MYRLVKKIFIPLIMCTLLAGCATWYQRNMQYSQSVSSGDYATALKQLESNKYQKKDKNEILYLLNLGYVQFMIGDYHASIDALNRADKLVETQRKLVGAEAAALLVNPETKPYRPEDFEVIMINVYKALDFIALGDLDGALVEVRRINIRLKQLNDKYGDNRSRYQQDAFAHLLMGVVYEAAGDDNNAFIAYRNAYNVYKSDYIKQFRVGVPSQLKYDLIRSAKQSGIWEEAERYSKEFNIPIEKSYPKDATVGLWFNGDIPYKSEWGIDFVTTFDKTGVVYFRNIEHGLSFPVPIPTGGSKEEWSNLGIVRAAFPKYTSRRPSVNQASIEIGGTQRSFQIVEDLDAIAHKTLSDRMAREMGNTLLRVATKQSIRIAAKNQNDWLGAAVGLAAALTEKADTRNWQTLPFEIGYCRIEKKGKPVFKSSPSRQTQSKYIDLGSTGFGFYTTR